MNHFSLRSPIRSFPSTTQHSRRDKALYSFRPEKTAERRQMRNNPREDLFFHSATNLPDINRHGGSVRSGGEEEANAGRPTGKVEQRPEEVGSD